MRIVLDEEEQAQIYRTDPEERGRGGFQSFMVELQRRFENGALDLGAKDIGRITRYAKYANGGYEGRLRKAFGRHFPEIFGPQPRKSAPMF